MKKAIAVLILVSLGVSAVAQETKDSYTAQDLVNKGFKRYNVESGMLIVKHSGSTEGADTTYFDMWGWREATYSDKTVSVMGFKTTTKEVSYLDGTLQYTYNPATKSATKINNTILKNLTERSKDKSLTDVGEQMLKDMGGQKVGTETILGKECTIYEVKNMGTKTWVWNGLTLKIVMNYMGMNMTSVAESLDTNVKVSTSRVTLPSDATITEMSLPPGFNLGGLGK